MIRLPQSSTLTDTLVPYTSLFRYQDVFDRHRHAVEGAARRSEPPALLRLRRGGQGAVGGNQVEGVQHAFVALDAVERSARGLHRRQRAAAMELRQPAGGHQGDIITHALAAL